MHSDHRFRRRTWLVRLALAGVLTLTVTHAQADPAPPAPAAVLTAASQPTYKTPEAASAALFEAVRHEDAGQLEQLLGDSGLVETDQPELDALERQPFAQQCGQMQRLARRTDGAFVLSIGPENGPFPVPIVPAQSAWRFDTGEALREVVFRRIGENELTAIDVCHCLAAASGVAAPASRSASEFSSLAAGDEGGELIARLLAAGQPGTQPVRFHGYECRVVAATAGHFMAVAYPAQYRSSGVMTFVVSGDDVVYERDLGPHTAAVAQALKDLPAASKAARWHRAEAITSQLMSCYDSDGRCFRFEGRRRWLTSVGRVPGRRQRTTRPVEVEL